MARRLSPGAPLPISGSGRPLGLANRSGTILDGSQRWRIRAAALRASCAIVAYNPARGSLRRSRAGVATLSVGNQTSAVPVAVFGGRLLAPMILRRIEAAGGGLRFAGLLNDTVAPGSTIEGDTVLGPFAAWPTLPADTQFVAPLHKAKAMPARAALVGRLGIQDARWATIVDPQTAIAPNARIGVGALVAPFVTVLPSTRLGRHVAIRQGVSIGHDVAIGDWCMIAANAAVAGRVQIGDGAYVGMGATLREEVSVGNWSVIGMGAAVLDDVPDFAIVAGNPARIIGEAPRP